MTNGGDGRREVYSFDASLRVEEHPRYPGSGILPSGRVPSLRPPRAGSGILAGYRRPLG